MHAYASGYKSDAGSVLTNTAGATAGSFVPWGPSMLGVGPGPGDGSIYPANLVKDIKKALKYAAEGDMPSAFGELAKDLVRGGAQMNRAIATDRYIRKGVLEEGERVPGSLFGWHTTPSGTDYVRKMKGESSGAEGTGAAEKWKRRPTVGNRGKKRGKQKR